MPNVASFTTAARDRVSSGNAAARLEHQTRRRIPAPENCRGAEASRRRHRGSFRISRRSVGAAAFWSVAFARLPARNHSSPTARPQRCACCGPTPVLRTRRHRRGVARALSDGQCRFRHVPAHRSLYAEPPRESPYWEALIATLSSQSTNRALAIGDFNTCRPYLDEAGAIDATAHYMDAIEQIGFRDLWRHRYPDRREYSWFGTRSNRFRIDHAFLSQELVACAGTVHYSHEERIAGLSDHSPLILELAA